EIGPDQVRICVPVERLRDGELLHSGPAETSPFEIGIGLRGEWQVGDDCRSAGKRDGGGGREMGWGRRRQRVRITGGIEPEREMTDETPSDEFHAVKTGGSLTLWTADP